VIGSKAGGAYLFRARATVNQSPQLISSQSRREFSSSMKSFDPNGPAKWSRAQGDERLLPWSRTQGVSRTQLLDRPEEPRTCDPQYCFGCCTPSSPAQPSNGTKAKDLQGLAVNNERTVPTSFIFSVAFQPRPYAPPRARAGAAYARLILFRTIRTVRRTKGATPAVVAGEKNMSRWRDPFPTAD